MIRTSWKSPISKGVASLSSGWARVPLSSFFLKFPSFFLIFPPTFLIFVLILALQVGKSPWLKKALATPLSIGQIWPLYNWLWTITSSSYRKKNRNCDTIKGNESHIGSTQFWFFSIDNLSISNASFWSKPHLNWTSGLLRYEQFFEVQNNKNLSPLLACNSKSIFLTSDSYPLIMSQFCYPFLHPY